MATSRVVKNDAPVCVIVFPVGHFGIDRPTSGGRTGTQRQETLSVVVVTAFRKMLPDLGTATAVVYVFEVLVDRFFAFVFRL